MTVDRAARSGDGLSSPGGGEHANTAHVTSIFILSYGLAVVMIYALLTWGTVWAYLSGTRLLRFLFDAGLVALTDADHGIILGIPDHKHYLGAYDPIGWPVLAVALILFLGHLALKAVQFHGIASIAGSTGTLGQHARAYVYGEGLGRLLPLNMGTTATVSALVGQGMSPARAGYAVYIARLFTIFEIAMFSIIALAMLGWITWMNSWFWGLVILGLSYFIIRKSRPANMPTLKSLEAVKQTVLYLTRKPLVLLSLCLVSLLSYVLLDMIAYLIAAAYSSEHVIFHFDHDVLLMALVAGYTASLIQITPGGIGQFEWGFAAALYVNGVAQPEAMNMALLYSGYRLLTSTIALIGVGTVFGIETSVRRVLYIFRGGPLVPVPSTA